MNALPNWYLSEIRKYQKIGFFKSESLDYIASKVVEESHESYFGHILQLQEDTRIAQILTSYDKTKVWFIEDWMTLGTTKEFENNLYKNVFKHLSKISSGSFVIQNITVNTAIENRVKVSFDIDNEFYSVDFLIDAEVLMLHFLIEINEILTLKRYSFQVVKDNYGPCFVLFLSDNEKEKLLEQGWGFESYTDYWLNRGQFARDEDEIENAMLYFNKAINCTKNPFAIAEYANFLIEHNKKKEAITVYEHGIKQIKEKDLKEGKEAWWLEVFEKEVKKLYL